MTPPSCLDAIPFFFWVGLLVVRRVMLREFFFCERRGVRFFAWFGLFEVLAHSVWSAVLKAQLNDWFKRFYDLLSTANFVSTASGEELVFGSGDASSGSLDDPLAEARNMVWDRLLDFCRIVAPALIIHPVNKFVRSHWTLAWRLSLCRAYMRMSKTEMEPIEGASQRTHEDTARFARGVDTCVVVVLDSLCTLIVFSPILYDIGTKVQPGDGDLPGFWLVAVACGSAFYGFGVALLLGRKLVRLEVNNQKVEAECRQKLVLLEVAPPRRVSPSAYMDDVWRALFRNYSSLYINFSILNTFLGVFEQFNVLLPYFMCGPLIFASNPDKRLTLGTLVQLSNAYGKVFGSLAVVSESVGEINEFRSVLVRLREFEAVLYSQGTRPLLVVDAQVELGSASSTIDVEGCGEGNQNPWD